MAEIPGYEVQAAVMRQRAKERTPAAAAQVTATMIAELESGQVTKAVQVGETAPDFTLQAAGSGTAYTLSEQVKSGPVVLSFYRGQW